MHFSTLFSGSSGNALYIENDDSSILVDAGVSGKRVEQALAAIGRTADDLNGLLVTHEHRDHICSVGVLSRRYDLPVYASAGTWQAMEADIGIIAEKNRCYLEMGEPLAIGSLDIECFSTSHDAADPVGFCFGDQTQRLGLLTDTGCFTASMEQGLLDCDTLVLESNHDLDMLEFGPYPVYLKRRISSAKGHLSNEDAAAALERLVTADTAGIVLAHLSQENNIPDLARETAAEMLYSIGCCEISLTVAPRSEPLPLLCAGKE